MDQDLIPLHVNRSLGEVANDYASQHVFEEYQQRKSGETRRRHQGDLKLFTQYLQEAGLVVSEDLYESASSWSMITYGLVEGFKRWMLQKAYSIGSINVRLSTVKKYCHLAFTSRVMSQDAHALIQMVKGYSYSEGINVDEQRPQTRREKSKKAHAIIISKEQCALLKDQPGTPQGYRDKLLICILFDHGLRCGEIAGLRVENINLNEERLTFYRRKVKKTQIHELTKDTRQAARQYIETCQPREWLLMGSQKGGQLVGRMSCRAITQRVTVLCRRIGIEGASAHDGRHAWVTYAVRGGTELKVLQDAGGWESIAMPALYAASQTVANKGVKLDN